MDKNISPETLANQLSWLLETLENLIEENRRLKLSIALSNYKRPRHCSHEIENMRESLNLI